MLRRSLIVITAVAVLCIAAAACGKKKSGGGPADFALLPLAQSGLVMPPNAGQAIPVSVDRSAGYRGAIDVTIAGAPSGVTAQPLTIAAGSTTGSLSVFSASSTAHGGPFAFDVVATGGGKTHSRRARVYVEQSTFGIDASLGSAGTMTTTCGGVCSGLQDVAFTPDDGMVATTISGAGTNDTFTVAKFTPVGVLDTSFGVGGVDTISIPGVTNSEAEHIAVDAQGRIVVAGVDLGATPDRVIVCRLHGDGSLDLTFNGSGCALDDVGTYDADVFDLKIDQTGRIYAAGEGYDSGSGNSVGYVMRLLDDGSLDAPGFGTGGEVVTATGTFVDQMYLAEDFSSGQLFMVGSGPSDWAVWRYNLDGTGHPGFGQTSTGFTQTTVPGLGGTLAVSSYGDILGAGIYQSGSPYPEAVVAFTSQYGAVDTSYGTNGASTAAYDNSNVGIAQMFYEDGVSSSYVWLVGTTNPGTANRSVVVSMMNAHLGGIDTSFGTNGFLILTVDGHPTYAAAAKRDAYGRIVVVEGYAPGTGALPAMQRFFAP